MKPWNPDADFKGICFLGGKTFILLPWRRQIVGADSPEEVGAKYRRISAAVPKKGRIQRQNRGRGEMPSEFSVGFDALSVEMAAPCGDGRF